MRETIQFLSLACVALEFLGLWNVMSGRTYGIGSPLQWAVWVMANVVRYAAGRLHIPVEKGQTYYALLGLAGVFLVWGCILIWPRRKAMPLAAKLTSVGMVIMAIALVWSPTGLPADL